MCIAAIATMFVTVGIIIGVIWVKRDNKTAFHRLREAV